jgi:hypothetical protein
MEEWRDIDFGDISNSESDLHERQHFYKGQVWKKIEIKALAIEMDLAESGINRVDDI